MTLKDLIPWYGTRGSDANDITDPFRRMQDDMERMLANFRTGLQWAPTLGLRTGDGLAAPTLDVSEDDDAVEVALDVPGVESKDIDVSIENGILTVSGKREEEKTEGGKDKNYHRVERYHGQFVRRVALPAGIDESAVDARHEKGVLRIRLPKTPEAQSKHKRIEIKSAA